jgi:small subunit ribosomal protein S20
VANIKSAKKRIKVINRQRKENAYVKATIATYVKKFRALVANGELEAAEAKLVETISLIDSAASKGVLHKNNASRKVSRLSAALDQAKAAVAPKTTAKVAKKAEEKVETAEVKATKKTTTKKAETEEKPAKKTTAKKAAKTETEEKPAKKTAAKKATKKAE